MSKIPLAVAPIIPVILHYTEILKFLLPFCPIHLEGRSLIFATDLERLVDTTFMSTLEDHSMLVLGIWGGRRDCIEKFVFPLPLATSVGKIEKYGRRVERVVKLNGNCRVCIPFINCRQDANVFFRCCRPYSTSKERRGVNRHLVVFFVWSPPFLADECFTRNRSVPPLGEWLRFGEGGWTW